MSKEIMIRECGKIYSDDIRTFTETAINSLPDYFFTCAASSSGRYHPTYALGEGGLVRHTLAAVRIANHILSLEQSHNQFTERERDYVISALLLHDGWKHGNGNSKNTVHEHPQVCADWIFNCDLFDNIISKEDREIIAFGVVSHMGEWNTSKRSKVVLEKPNNKIQKMIHLCDYLASRKDIEILFDEAESNTQPSSIDNCIMPYGKYKGKRLVEIAQMDINYLRWMKENDKITKSLINYVDELIAQ